MDAHDVRGDHRVLNDGERYSQFLLKFPRIFPVLRILVDAHDVRGDHRVLNDGERYSQFSFKISSDISQYFGSSWTPMMFEVIIVS